MNKNRTEYKRLSDNFQRKFCVCFPRFLGDTLCTKKA